jgi:hypothetical protein
MNADLIRRLSDADPAAEMPLEDASRREALRESVVAGSVSPRSKATPSRRHRRLIVAIAIAGGIMLLAGSAYAANVVLNAPDTAMNDDQVQSQYEVWQKNLPLPPGVEWHVLQRIPNVMYAGDRAGEMEVYSQALAEWCAEWIAAAEAGDAARTSAAIAELAHIRRAMPIWREGMSEGDAGFDAGSFVPMFDKAVAEAKQGDFKRLRLFTDGAEQPPLVLDQWCEEWIKAAEAGDDERVAHAIAELARIRAAMPIATTGLGENLSDAEQVDFMAGFDAAVAAAKQGDFDLLYPFAGMRDPSLPPAPEREQAHFVKWSIMDPWTEVPEDEMVAEFRAIEQQLKLPPGVQWIQPKLHPAGSGHEKYVLGTGTAQAIMFAWKSWWREWVAAAEAGDAGRIAAAEDASSEIGKLLPASPPDSENVDRGGFVVWKQSIDDFHRYDQRARAGDLEGIKAWLRRQNMANAMF